jgi:4-hydroxy-tetrahydrodipicolinate reductase
VTPVLVHGASGRMGRSILRLMEPMPDLALAAAVTRSGRHGLAPGLELPSERLGECPEFRVAIDFSLPDAFDAIMSLCVERKAALVSGTTGLNASQDAALSEASIHIPVLWAANFSPGVAVLAELVERAAAALPGWDADIIESHHVHKRDAPSGTALALGARVSKGRGHEPHYAALRAGDIVGEHTVQLSGLGERLELIHRATDRDIFARGALHAAVWIAGQPPGRYTMKDCLGLS